MVCLSCIGQYFQQLPNVSYLQRIHLRERSKTFSGGMLLKKMVAFFIVIISLLSSAIGSQTNIELFQDMLEMYNMNHPMIICRNLNDEGLQELISSTTQASTINYDKEEEMDDLFEKVKYLQYLGDLDSILFVGSGHQKLIVKVTNNLKLFQFGITGVIPMTEYSNLNLSLHLDTRLFVLKDKINDTKIEEVYAIKGKPITSKVGSWNETARLKIDEPNIWERRSNLYGVTIRVTSLNYSTLHYLNNDVSGGGGYFIEPLYYLTSKLNFKISFLYSSDGKWGGREYISNLALNSIAYTKMTKFRLFNTCK